MCIPSNNSNLPNEAPVTVTGGGDATAAKQQQIIDALGVLNQLLQSTDLGSSVGDLLTSATSGQGIADMLYYNINDGSTLIDRILGIQARLYSDAGGDSVAGLMYDTETNKSTAQLLKGIDAKLQTLINMLLGGEARVVITDTAGNIADVDSSHKALKVVTPG